jgi:hypothetical protein
MSIVGTYAEGTLSFLAVRCTTTGMLRFQLYWNTTEMRDERVIQHALWDHHDQFIHGSDKPIKNSYGSYMA